MIEISRAHKGLYIPDLFRGEPGVNFVIHIQYMMSHPLAIRSLKNQIVHKSLRHSGGSS